MKTPIQIVSAAAGAVRRFAGRVHGDQRGSISIASVFALLLLVFLLGMVMNSTRQVDQKVKMQNAADAATYSGGVVITRNMNTLAFTNHLLADVFALTAFMREARDRNAESLTPEILANWERVGPEFQGSEFPKFDELGAAIVEKVPHEREMIRTFGDWAAAASERMLPVLEEILAERMIPEFQRSLVETTPQLAQYAADEVARRHGQAWPRKAELRAVLWRTSGSEVGGMNEDQRRSLPVVDPVMDVAPNREEYMDRAKRQRRHLAFKYLGDWNNESLSVFDAYGKMSQFSQLWRICTRGYLKELLEEQYPNTNLPFQIRTYTSDINNLNDHLEQDFMFVGVVYNKKMREHMSGVFRNPIPTDAQAFAQIMMFVPRRRLIKQWRSPNSGNNGSSANVPNVSVPGDSQTIVTPPNPGPPPPGADDDRYWVVGRQWYPRYPDIARRRRDIIPGTERIHWDLTNQNWTMQLVPATAHNMPRILSTSPSVNEISGVETPSLEELNSRDMWWITHH